MSDPSVRRIAEDELGAFIDVVRTAFLSPPASPELVAARRAHTDLDRCLGAYDDHGRLCGATRDFATPLTVPGGELTAAAVSSVGVLPTHTRQGHLRRLMDAQLAGAAEHGEPVAILIAAEYPIYGRFGYGPATEAAGLRIDATAARWREGTTGSGSVEIVGSETFAKEIDGLYERARRRHPGHIGGEAAHWAVAAGVVAQHDGGDQKRRDATKVVWRDEAGEPQAACSYAIDESWVHNRPSNTLQADAFVAASDRAEREMLRFLATIDWVSEVSVGLRPVDDPAPLALVDGRAARLVDRSDHTWLRVLDAPTTLAGRRYATAGSLVIDVDDPLGYAHGRFRVDAGPDGAACTRTTDDADLGVPVGALGAAYLGGHTWDRLAAAGWVDEHRPGAVARASALFAVPRAPWGALTF
jgi:predicted acetyltransferase